MDVADRGLRRRDRRAEAVELVAEGLEQSVRAVDERDEHAQLRDDAGETSLIAAHARWLRITILVRTAQHLRGSYVVESITGGSQPLRSRSERGLSTELTSGIERHLHRRPPTRAAPTCTTTPASLAKLRMAVGMVSVRSRDCIGGASGRSVTLLCRSVTRWFSYVSDYFRRIR